MKLTPADIAEALIDLLESKAVSAEEACDTALQMLHRDCPSASPGAFLALVVRVLRKRRDAHAGVLRTATVSEAPKSMQQELQQAFGKAVDLEAKTDASLIGGAILDVNDTRIDASVKRALEDLHELYSKPVS